MRVAAGVLAAQPDRRAALATRSFARSAAHAVDRCSAFADAVADGHARVERRVRVLEDDLHLAAQTFSSRAVAGRDALALEAHRAGGRARSAAGWCGRRSSCHSRTRPPGRGSRRGARRSSTSSTACTRATTRCSRPPRTGKYLTQVSDFRDEPLAAGPDGPFRGALTVTARAFRRAVRAGRWLFGGGRCGRPAAHLVPAAGRPRARRQPRRRRVRLVLQMPAPGSAAQTGSPAAG